jgi:hypothetical protein
MDGKPIPFALSLSKGEFVLRQAQHEWRAN